MRFQGTVYRALNPRWAVTPLSGAGAARHGGRFNPKGFPALYLCLTPETIILETVRDSTFQPTTIISCIADIDPVFDARDAIALAERGLSPSDLASDTWQREMRRGEIATTQKIAMDLVEDGFHGMLVPSFAPRATPACTNLVLWKWDQNLPHYLSLIDDEGRLRPH